MAGPYMKIDFLNDGPDYRRKTLHTEHVKFNTLENSTIGLEDLGFWKLDGFMPGSSATDGVNAYTEKRRRRRR